MRQVVGSSRAAPKTGVRRARNSHLTCEKGAVPRCLAWSVARHQAAAASRLWAHGKTHPTRLLERWSSALEMILTTCDLRCDLKQVAFHHLPHTF